MNKLVKLISVAFMLLFYNSVYSQWYLTSGHIFDCDFPVQDTGYVVGESGTIRKTFDGGMNWYLLHSECTHKVEEVHFFTANTGYAYTSNEIITTIDGGYSWEKISNPSDKAIVDVFFLNENNWYLIDLCGDFYYTTTGGTDWSEAIQFESHFSNEYRNVLFLDQNNGFIVGDYLYTTTNGGNTWIKNTDYWVDNIYFLDQSTGFIYGGYGYKTTDGGLTWNQIDLLEIIKKMDFTENGVGYCVGDEEVYKTTDYGTNWTEIASFETSLNTVVALNNNSCIVAGYKASIYKTTDDGISWDTISEYPDYIVYLQACTFIDSSKVIAVSGSGAVLMSYDAGVTWKIKVDKDSWGVSAYDVFFVDADIGYISTNPGIFKTTDGGESWTQVNNVVSGFKSQLYFLNNNTGFLVNSSALIYKTTDGGINWEEIDSDANYPLLGINFINENTGFIVGEHDTYLYTNDGGNTWIKPTYSPLNGSHSAVWFHDSQNGCIGGSRLYKTNDGGETWSMFSNPDGYINSFCFLGEDTIFSVSNEVYNWVNKSIDGGLTWDIIPWGSFSTVFQDIASFEKKEIIAVGEYTLKPALTLISPTYDPGVSVEYIEPKKDYSILPNPVKDILYISTLNPNSSIQNIEIIDIYGRILSKQNINNNDGVISLSFLKAGYYLIRINTKYIFKIVKQ